MSEQADLLSSQRSINQPLAARMRPTTLDDYAGQQQVIGAESALRTALVSGHLPSMVLWGPPGSGKTTLAKIIAHSTDHDFCELSAVSAGVKDIKIAVESAKMRAERSGFGQGGTEQQESAHKQGTLLFIDEVHRFNKAQQDALLPHIESGLFAFIGATTENPSFELNNALLSRLTVYRLEALNENDLQKILQRALSDCTNGLGGEPLQVSEQVIVDIAKQSQGDARAALSTLETAAQIALAKGQGKLDSELLATLMQERSVQFDKGGDHFYDQISALHKSVRGSSPDAALYWLARMLSGGCDPLYVARRVVRMASEDVGNADPRALRIALDAWDVQSRLGSPEGELSLAQAVVYLAVAPKSNAVYSAFTAAMKLAREHGAEPVPLHIRNAPTDLMKTLGHGEDYRYAHDYRDENGDAYVAGEQYLPETLAGTKIYKPADQGLEQKIRQKLSDWAERDRTSEFQRYPLKPSAKNSVTD
jgi:putative ATPase